MHIELVILGSAFAALATVVKLTGQRQRAWVERDLYMGDLRALSGVAFRRNIRPPSIIVSRLEDRGFMGRTGRGSCRVTLKGWIAVLLRHTSARRFEITRQ
jgi:hypothetical protein